MNRPTTSPAARLRQATGRLRGRSVRPAALAGAIDLLDLEPGVELACDEIDRETSLVADGVALRFDTAAVRWHATADAITLVTGTPRAGGRALDAEQLGAWLAEQPAPWAALGGRFAVVRVDLAAGEVALVTDRFGVWPLAWSRTGTCIAFSDRADVVAALVGDGLDPQALFDYVYFHVIPSPRTIFRGVERLEPATAVCVSSIATRREVRWRPAFARGAAEGRVTADRFRATVSAVVLAEADAAASEGVGCFLSGGTDSSTVAGMLARARGAARTFSIGFDTEGYDELAYARIAARHFGAEHHAYTVTPDDLVRAIPLVAAHYDQPFGNSSALPAYYCARMAAHHGVRRMLAGDGGDELFGGNVRYAKQKLFEAYRRVPRVLRSSLLEPLLMNRAARATPGVAKAASYVSQACVPMPARMETYNLLARFGPANVFAARFLEQVDASAPAALQAEIYGRSAGAAFVDRMLSYDWRFTLTDNDLPKVTGTSALAGVEVGFPLLDDALVDLSTRLGANEKVRGLRLRHFFKQSLAGFLPPEIIAKRKHGFGLPVGPWLATRPAFRVFAHDAVQSLAERRLIRRALVEDLFSRRLTEHPGYYGEMIWVLAMLEHWLRARAPAWSCE